MILGKMTPTTDHVAQAVGKLLQKYKGKPRFEALLKSYVRQVQDLEDATWEVIDGFDLDNADDVRTEILGRLVGQPRRGETLAKYKMYIRARILVNRSLGRAADVLALTAVLLDDPGTYYEGDPAFFSIEATEPLGADVDPHIYVEMVREAKAAGVGFAFIYPIVPFAESFTYGNALVGETANPNQGFDSTTEETGGKYVSVIR